MGLLGDLLGSIVENVVENVKDSSDSKYIEELKPKMMNSAIANDFEMWFRSQLNSKPFLYSQYNYYDNCERAVFVDNDGVSFYFEIEVADVSDTAICNFANTLGYKPLTANGLTCSDGKLASERVLIKAFAEVVRDRVKKVFDEIPGNFSFGSIEYDDGTDKNGSYIDRVSQRASAAAFGESAKLNQLSGFTYTVPKQEQKSAF